jgi:opacity protein-like surface antigen
MKNIVRKQIARAGALCLAISAVLPAFANEAGDIYVGAEWGTVEASGPGPGNNSNFVSGQHFNDGDSTYGLHLGYSFTDWFAIELGATDFGSVTDTFKLRDDIVFIVKPNDTQTLEAKGLSLSGVFSKKLGNKWSLQGLLGVSAMDYDSTLSGGFSEQSGSLLVSNSYDEQGLVYGLGAAYQLTGNLSLRIAARRYDVGDFELDTANLGISYRF